MNLTRLGTDYGGWYCSLDMIPEGSTILDLGVGEDFSFSAALIQEKAVNIVAVDPTVKSKEFMKNFEDIECVSFLNRAITTLGGHVTMHRNNNPDHVSDSRYYGHSAVGSNGSYSAPGVSIALLRELYPDLSLIKMDIEGSEYDVYEQTFGIPQVLIEVHDFCMGHGTDQKTATLKEAFDREGYTLFEHGNDLHFIKKPC
jgi:FkbM family methyltransferase